MPLRNIVQLMGVSRPQRNLEWLQDSLVNAVQLELATLPPYLCAYWSIKNPNEGQAGDFISSIYMQEMKHMGLAANMLVAVGGTPQINTAVPTYPGPLPGGVRPELTVYLGGLTPAFLHDVCMEIEMPEQPLVRMGAGEEFPTIGAFYDAIQDAFRALQPKISPTYQQTSYIGVNEIKTVQDALDAIDVIKREGEGTKTSPDEAMGSETLAHYYKFASIYHGFTLARKENGEWAWEGTVVPWPDVWPVATVPAGGWGADSPASIKDFNEVWTSLLNKLQGAWTGDGDVDDATSIMRRLASRGAAIVQTPIGDGTKGNYCPDFLPIFEFLCATDGASPSEAEPADSTTPR